MNKIDNAMALHIEQGFNLTNPFTQDEEYWFILSDGACTTEAEFRIFEQQFQEALDKLDVDDLEILF